MMIDRIQWENDWPVVACDGTPSTQSPMPASGRYDCSDGDDGDDGAGGDDGVQWPWNDGRDQRSLF